MCIPPASVPASTHQSSSTPAQACSTPLQRRAANSYCSCHQLPRLKTCTCQRTGPATLATKPVRAPPLGLCTWPSPCPTSSLPQPAPARPLTATTRMHTRKTLHPLPPCIQPCSLPPYMYNVYTSLQLPAALSLSLTRTKISIPGASYPCSFPQLLALSCSFLRSHTAISSSSFQWSHTGTSVLAQMVPEAATAGSPMPGKVLSPQHISPGMGVVGPVGRCG